MPSEMLTKQKGPSSPTPPAAVAPEKDERRAATRQHVKRVRRLKINVAAWVLGTILLTTLWVVNQWQGNGTFESFGHEGEAGQWNPTLWALAVGIWGLTVGIMALPGVVRSAAPTALRARNPPAGADDGGGRVCVDAVGGADVDVGEAGG